MCLFTKNDCFLLWNHNSFHFGFQGSHFSFDGMKYGEKTCLLVPPSLLLVHFRILTVQIQSSFSSPSSSISFLLFILNTFVFAHICHLSNYWPSLVMTKTLSSLCWTYFVRINSICDQSNCNCQADSGPRPRPRFQSLLVATDWHSCYPYPQPFSALICQLRQKFNTFRWTDTTIIIWWSVPTALVFLMLKTPICMQSFSQN